MSDLNFAMEHSLGDEGSKGPHCWPLFSSILKNSRKTMGQAPFVTFAPRLYKSDYNHYNHAHAPGLHMWPSPGPWPDSKCSKTAEV